MNELLACDGVVVATIADTQPEAVARAAAQVTEAGQVPPKRLVAQTPGGN